MESEDEFEVLVEVYRIVERKDGAVYRTEKIGKRWVPMSHRGKTFGDETYASLSTSDPEFNTLPRRKK